MIEKRNRIVIDTNVFVSASLSLNSIPGRAVRLAFEMGAVLSSPDTLQELKVVIARPKFNRIRTLAAREKFLAIYLDLFEPFILTDLPVNVTDCRDPDDNKFLALALAGNADLILTGDLDLLALHPWRGIPILTPSAYLARPL